MKFEGIKCLYTLKEIFSLVRTNRKMNIIIYNKELQEMIEEADRDGDGEIGEDDFLKIMKKTNLF